MLTPPNCRWITCCALIIGAFSAPVLWAEGEQDAARFLSFESVNDGRCQILSSGGKLRVMRNGHSDSTIKYRLIRVFVGKPQGRSVGLAEPGDKPVKLGCTRVDGRTQDWIVERAQFVTDES